MGGYLLAKWKYVQVNGTLYLAYRGTIRELDDQFAVIGQKESLIFIRTSQDGENWSSPIRVEPVVNDAAVEVLSEDQRIHSSIIGGIVTLGVLVYFLKKYSSYFLE